VLEMSVRISCICRWK